MPEPISRRAWLGRSISAAVAGAALSQLPSVGAVEPFKRPAKPHMRLSLAAYSFREHFKDANHKRDKTPAAGSEIDLFQFLDYCADHHCDAAELTSYYFPANTDREFLLKIKRHAFLRGLAISGTAIGNTFTYPKGEKRDKEMALLKKWVDNAAIMGAPHIRVFAGAAPAGVSHDEAVKNCIDTLNEACAYAGEHGVFLGIENHGGIVAESDALIKIIETVKSDWLGINLDSANFHTADPYADFARCAPYAVNVQIKTETQPKGKSKERSDLARYVKILADAKYQGYVALEFEEAADPYKTIPGVLKELRALVDA